MLARTARCAGGGSYVNGGRRFVVTKEEWAVATLRDPAESLPRGPGGPPSGQPVGSGDQATSADRPPPPARTACASAPDSLDAAPQSTGAETGAQGLPPPHLGRLNEAEVFVLHSVKLFLQFRF